jgi:hypothetical protein
MVINEKMQAQQDLLFNVLAVPVRPGTVSHSDIGKQNNLVKNIMWIVRIKLLKLNIQKGE